MAMMATAVLAWSMLLPMPVQGQGDTSSAPCGSDSYLDPESQSCTPLSRCNTQCSGTTGTSFYGACSCPTFCLVCLATHAHPFFDSIVLPRVLGSPLLLQPSSFQPVTLLKHTCVRALATTCFRRAISISEPPVLQNAFCVAAPVTSCKVCDVFFVVCCVSTPPPNFAPSASLTTTPLNSPSPLSPQLPLTTLALALATPGLCVASCPTGYQAVGTGGVGRSCEPTTAVPPDDTSATAVPLEFELHAGTATSDRVCAGVTVCSEHNAHETAPATPTTDTACKANTNCSAVGAYVATPSDGFSDNVCEPLTVCHDSAEYEAVAPTTTTDRMCSSVSPPCHEANADTFQTHAPTASTDRTCANLTACDFGLQFVALQATATTDRVCEPLTQCVLDGEQQYIARTPTATSDRECGDTTECALFETFETSAPTATSNRECSDCTDCSAVSPPAFQNAPCTLTSDAECKPCDTCSDTQFEVCVCVCEVERGRERSRERVCVCVCVRPCMHLCAPACLSVCLSVCLNTITTTSLASLASWRFFL